MKKVKGGKNPAKTSKKKGKKRGKQEKNLVL